MDHSTRAPQTLPALYPLRFDPVFKDYPWGGRNLADRLGRQIPDGIVAESWEIAAHASGTTTVAAGALAGRTLPDLMASYGEALVGQNSREALVRGRFPLLIKLLDANEWLSVQVHPADDYALRHEGDLGKTEMWVVLHADPEAELIYGLKEGVSPERFRQAVAAGRVPDVLNRVPVCAGDVVYVPAGTVHALGPGTIVAEIQQNSDTTYRIYDWGRLGNDGRPRPLHVERALEVIDWAQSTPQIRRRDSARSSERLAHSRYFHTERFRRAAGETLSGHPAGATFQLLGLLSGRGWLRWAGGEERFDALSWRLIPAALDEYHFEAESTSELLRVRVPGAESADM